MLLLLLLLFRCLLCCRGEGDDAADDAGGDFGACFCLDFGSASETDFDAGLFRFATNFVDELFLLVVVLSEVADDVRIYALMYSLSDAVCVDIKSDLLFTGLIETIEWMGNGVSDLLLDELVLIVLRIPLAWCPLRCSHASAFVSTVISDMTS